jgi:hypothetical protein
LCCFARLLFCEDRTPLFLSRLDTKPVTFLTLFNVSFGHVSLVAIGFYLRDVWTVNMKTQTMNYFYYQFPVPDSSLRCLN